MWLINIETLELEHVLDHTKTAYAILSHTWEEGEVTFQEFRDHRDDVARRKKGFRKIERVCELARSCGSHLRCAWVDTCCIDKTSSAELSEAINSMYRWYADSTICYAYLGDLPAAARRDNDESGAKSQLAPGLANDIFQCRWWTRGWTLQELIAPAKLTFLDRDFNYRGTKLSLQSKIAEITGIEKKILFNRKPLSSVHVARRMSWAATRETTRAEDAAYCLMGIFDINMPLLYGEGNKAFLRLQEEICRRSNGDLTLFAWTADAPPVSTKDDGQEPEAVFRGILARHPREFLSAKTLGKQPAELHKGELSVTNKGIRIDGTELLHAPDLGVFLRLGRLQPDDSQPGKGNMYVHLTKTMEGYVRTRADQLFFGLASSWNTHWLPPENVYVACDLSLSDQQKVAKQRRNMVRFTVAAASSPPPSPSGAGGQGGRSIRLGQATYPLHFWDRHESATLLDFTAQQEGLVELVATLADGCTTGRLVLAWSSYMAPVEGQRNKRQSALKYTLLDARSPHWEATSATLRGTNGGRAVDRLLRYEVLEDPLVRHGEGVSKFDQLRIAGEDVEVTLTITRPEGSPLRWRSWKVEVSCDTGGGGNQGALNENSRTLQDIDAPGKRSLVHAATWKTL